MGRISSGIGLISNIDYRSIIDQLMTLEARPKDQLKERIDKATERKLAYTDLSMRLSGLKLTATTLKKPSTFQAASAKSSNENVLTATASNGASMGNYQFQVARLVTTQQSVSAGFSDFNSARVGAGTVTIEQGGGELSTQSPLSQLNGGNGVRRGKFRITDRSGASAVIDTTAAVTLDDVVKQVNTSLGISVRASINGDGLVLTDLTGKTTNNFVVADIGDGTTATDLGIAANEASATIAGGDIQYLGSKTLLDQVNDGRGVRHATTGADFRITARDGTTYDVTLGTARTIGEVVDKINAAVGTKAKADLAPGSNGIRLADTSGGLGAFSVTALNGSKAAADLGLRSTTTGPVINGEPILAGLNTVLISSLQGGQGMPLGQIRITDRTGMGATIDLAGSKTVQDILDRISNATTISVKASLKASGNGIQITDNTGDIGDLVIDDLGGGTTAAVLGIRGTFNNTVTSVQGNNLQRQWVSENTLLADFNGGKGVTPGRFKVTNANGLSATIDLTTPGILKLGQVMEKINAAGIGVTASINPNGDGLMLTDGSGGPGKMKVEETNGTTAANLNIKGEATANVIDGSFEKTLTLDANDTLATTQQKIAALNFGVSATIINDGTGLAPYRLSLTAKGSGRDGRVVIDGGTTSLSTRMLVEAQDAAVFLGSADAAEPLLVTAGQNQITGVIQGVTIELHGVSNGPVSLGVTRNADKVIEDLTKFTESFNEMADKIREFTKFDTDTRERGLLLGDSSVRTVETLTYSMFTASVSAAGKFRVLADVGLKLVAEGKIEFDEDKFRQAYAADPESVQRLFSESETTTVGGKASIKGLGIGWMMESSFTRLIDPVDGVITRENKTLDQKTDQFQDRIKSLDTALIQKRARLERQFADLEGVLAGLQSQQQALGAFQPMQPMNRR